MNEPALHVLLDQNVPRAIADWLRALRPAWRVSHVTEVGLDGRPDDQVFGWAQQHNAVVITFDEDFADLRMYPLGKHKGVVRLRVWPTTVEETQRGLERLLTAAGDHDLIGSLIIVDAHRIRIRRRASQ